jgi:PAS domain-containing protein
MLRLPPPAKFLPVTLLACAFLLQAGVVLYLGARAQAQQRADWRQAQVQIARDLASQIARAQAENNDLAALASLGSARGLHPQLLAAMVFDPSGKVLLHTDPGQLGRTVPAPVGVRLTTPESGPWQEGGRRGLAVLVPLPDRDENYLRALFDGSGLEQGGLTLRVHALLLTLCVSVLLALGCRAWLARYEWLDPLARAASPAAPPAVQPMRRVAGLLLAEMPHAALTLDRDNVILAANGLALELLNCRQEELVGFHMLKAPVPPPLLEFYQQALPAPGRPQEGRLRLNPRSPELSGKVTFAPASDQWELALITLR